jgi:hypothetical protein
MKRFQPGEMLVSGAKVYLLVDTHEGTYEQSAATTVVDLMLELDALNGSRASYNTWDGMSERDGYC